MKQRLVFLILLILFILITGLLSSCTPKSGVLVEQQRVEEQNSQYLERHLCVVQDINDELVDDDIAIRVFKFKRISDGISFSKSIQSLPEIMMYEIGDTVMVSPDQILL